LENAIVAFINTPEIKNNLQQAENKTLGTVLFLNNLNDYYRAEKLYRINLVIFETKNLLFSDEFYQIHLFNISHPKLIIHKVKENLFAFPILDFHQIGKQTKLEVDELIEVVNQYNRSSYSSVKVAAREGLIFVTRHPKMLKILEDAKKIAPGEANVLLTGELGTGKELLARIIHQFSGKEPARFVKVSCAVSDLQLSNADTSGVPQDDSEDIFSNLSQADGGILFLHHVNQLNPYLQRKLLRILETGESSTPDQKLSKKIDFKILSSSEENLAEAVKDGRFSRDLWIKLSGINFNLIPLRHRKEDIPLLIRHFTTEFNRKYNKKVAEIGSDMVKNAADIYWPGNVLELKQFVDRVVFKCDKNVVEAEFFKNELKDFDFESGWENGRNTLERQLAIKEQQVIINTLKKYQFRLIESSKHLGISRQSLFRKIKRYNIQISQLKDSLKSQ
jgi:DNA-binding NtrC family response regulator